MVCGRHSCLPVLATSSRQSRNTGQESPVNRQAGKPAPHHSCLFVFIRGLIPFRSCTAFTSCFPDSWKRAIFFAHDERGSTEEFADSTGREASAPATVLADPHHRGRSRRGRRVSRLAACLRSNA